MRDLSSTFPILFGDNSNNISEEEVPLKCLEDNIREQETLFHNLNDLKKCLHEAERGLREAKIEKNFPIYNIITIQAELRVARTESDSLRLNIKEHKFSSENNNENCKVNIFLAWTPNMSRLLPSF